METRVEASKGEYMSVKPRTKEHSTSKKKAQHALQTSYNIHTTNATSPLTRLLLNGEQVVSGPQGAMVAALRLLHLGSVQPQLVPAFPCAAVYPLSMCVSWHGKAQ